MTTELRETIKNYLTVSEVIDRCVLSGIEETNIQPTEPIRIVSINNVPLKNDIIGIATIGFVKSQIDRKHQLAQRLTEMLNNG